MADVVNLYISTRDGVTQEQAFRDGIGSASAPAQVAILPAVVLGDSRIYKIYLTDDVGGYDSRSGSASYTPRLALSVPGLAPTGGTFYLGFGTATSGTLTSGKRYEITIFVAGDVFTNIGATSNATGVVFTATGTTPTTWTNGSTVTEITTEIAYDAAETVVQAALNATASVTAAGGVIVDGVSPIWQVVFNTAGARADFTGLSATQNLLPDGQVVVSTVTTGTSAVKARQSVLLARGALCAQDTFSSIANGWQCSLSAATLGLQLYLGDDAKKAPGDGQVLEFELTTVATGLISTLAQAPIEVRNQVIRPGVFVPTPTSDFYTRTEVDALIAAISALAVTNLASRETLTFSAAGNTAVTPAAGFNQHVALVQPTAGAGVFTRTLSVLVANAASGSTVRVRLEMPASVNPTVQLRNNAAGGTLLATATPSSTAYVVIWDLVFNATSGEYILSETVYESAPNFRFNAGLLQLQDDSSAGTWKTLRQDGSQVYLT